MAFFREECDDHVNFTSFGPIAKLAPIMIKMVYSIAVVPSCQNIWKRAHQKGTVALRKIQRIPGTYPRPSTTCLWFGNPFIFVFWGTWGMFHGSVAVCAGFANKNQAHQNDYCSLKVISRMPCWIFLVDHWHSGWRNTNKKSMPEYTYPNLSRL